MDGSSKFQSLSTQQCIPFRIRNSARAVETAKGENVADKFMSPLIVQMRQTSRDIRSVSAPMAGFLR